MLPYSKLSRHCLKRIGRLFIFIINKVVLPQVAYLPSVLDSPLLLLSASRIIPWSRTMNFFLHFPRKKIRNCKTSKENVTSLSGLVMTWCLFAFYFILRPLVTPCLLSAQTLVVPRLLVHNPSTTFTLVSPSSNLGAMGRSRYRSAGKLASHDHFLPEITRRNLNCALVNNNTMVVRRPNFPVRSSWVFPIPSSPVLVLANTVVLLLTPRILTRPLRR